MPSQFWGPWWLLIGLVGTRGSSIFLLGSLERYGCRFRVRERHQVDGIFNVHREYRDRTCDSLPCATVFKFYASQTIATVSMFLLAILENPEILHKSQTEIDRVVGSRLPTFEDRAQLPYGGFFDRN